MNPESYKHFVGVVRERTGIEIGDDKQYLVESRLKPLAQTYGFAEVTALLDSLRFRPDPRLLESVLDAMTTNETFFFRDDAPFKALVEALPRLAEANRGAPVRVWSAACSTGQEPYSIAMAVTEAQRKTPGLRVEIIGSDISDRCLAKARAGIYSQFEVQRGVSMRRLADHFEQDGLNWRIKPELRGAVSWRRMNLHDSFALMGKMDVIFCRNVLIYFAREARRDILERMLRQMKEDGVLYLGASENTVGITEAFMAAPGGVGLSPRKAAGALAPRPAPIARPA
jgi:chemotaxis protein methyltransferase CheR